MRSTTSSTLTAPSSWPLSSSTGIASMSYDANCSNTSRSGVLASTVATSTQAVTQLHARRFAQQPLHEHDAEVLAGRWLQRRLADEHLAGDAGRPVRVAELGERLGDGVGRAEDHDLGRHHAARRRLLVGEQPGDDLGLVVVHRREDRGALMDRHLVEQVGEVVVLHLVEHADQAVEVEALDQAQLLGPRAVPRAGRRGVRRPSPRRAGGAAQAAARARRRRRRTGACRAGGRPRRPPRWCAANSSGTSSQSTSR